MLANDRVANNKTLYIIAGALSMSPEYHVILDHEIKFQCCKPKDTDKMFEKVAEHCDLSYLKKKWLQIAIKTSLRKKAIPHS